MSVFVRAVGCASPWLAQAESHKINVEILMAPEDRAFSSRNQKHMQRSLLVLAAGLGSRYGGLKQIDPVGPAGETIMDYSIYDGLRAGFDSVIFVIRRSIEQAFRESIGRRFETRLSVNYVFQELDALPAGFSVPAGRLKPWGTAHAILAAKGAVKGSFGVINADDFYGAGSFRMLAEHLRDSMDHAIVGFTLRNTLSEFGSVARGVCEVQTDGFLRSVTEVLGIEKNGDGARCKDASSQVRNLTGDQTVSMNMWGFEASVFGHLERAFREFLTQRGDDPNAECYIPTVVNDLVRRGQARVKVLRSAESWLGITHRDDRAVVERGIRSLIERGTYPARLWD